MRPRKTRETWKERNTKTERQRLGHIATTGNRLSWRDGEYETQGKVVKRGRETDMGETEGKSDRETRSGVD